VRPIAPQSGIAKVLERVLLRSVTNIPEALLGQFGVGYPDGRGALLALCLRRMLADPGCVLLQLDVSNAFSSIPRDQLYATLCQSPSFRCLAPWFKIAYGQELQLTVRGEHGVETVPCNTGVIQGSVLGPLLYAIYVQPVTDAIKRAFPQVTVALYIDDTAMVGPPDQVERAADMFYTLLAERGLRVNADKSVLTPASLLRDEQPPAPVRVAVHGHEVLGRVDGTVLLGSPIGTAAFVAKTLNDLAVQHNSDLIKLGRNVRHLQTRYQLISVCMNGALDHVAGSLLLRDFDAAQEVLKIHDNNIKTAALRIMDNSSPTDPDPQWTTLLDKERVSLPLDFAGLGIGNSAVPLRPGARSRRSRPPGQVRHDQRPPQRPASSSPQRAPRQV
jgi:hypothetical protein